MNYIKQYLNQQLTHRAASQWLGHTNADHLAAYCLFWQNRIAKRNRDYSKQQFIYTCKNHLVRLFYERGYCTEVTRQLQGLTCWHTRAYNEGWDDYCDKCDNTGWYRHHYLYLFVFDIGGRRYIWHQPETMVTWPIALSTEKAGDYQQHFAGPTGLTTELGNLYRAVMYQYLLQHSIPRGELPKLMTFKSALCSQWYWSVWYRISPRRWWFELKYKTRRKRNDLLHWLQKQAKLRPGDVAQTPFDPSGPVKVLRIDCVNHYPFSPYGEYVAMVEYLSAHPHGYAIGSEGCYKADELRPETLRIKVAKRLLAWANWAEVAWLNEDEIPF